VFFNLYHCNKDCGRLPTGRIPWYTACEGENPNVFARRCDGRAFSPFAPRKPIQTLVNTAGKRKKKAYTIAKSL
jgi:hypothetical protein